MLSASTDVCSYSSNIPSISHSNIYNERLNLGAPPQQFQGGNPLPTSTTVEYPNIGQPQTIYPPLATGIDWQQSTSLPQNSLHPHLQFQEWNDLALLDSFLRASASSGPPPDAATTSLPRESVDESELQVTDLLPR